MVPRSGRYGRFYGYSNFPKSTRTMKEGEDAEAKTSRH